MFKYVSDISMIFHYIIKEFLENKNSAIDATLGNGHDTDFLNRSKEAPILMVIEKKQSNIIYAI